MRGYGNLMNRLGEDSKSATPLVNMGATLMSYSDRYAYTITRIDPKGKKLWATQDIATRSDSNGMSDAQSYTYSRDPERSEELFTLRKDGRWHQGKTLRGLTLCIGHRDAYHDFSF